MRFLALLVALSLPLAGHSAIAVNSSVVNGVAVNTGNTFSFTTGSGSDRLLVVLAQSTCASCLNSVSSATFNSVALTKKSGSVRTGTSNTNVHTEVWYLVNPTAATTANIVISYTSSNANAYGAIQYSGVDQTTIFGALTATSSATSPLSVTLTTTLANSWVLNASGAYASTSGTVDAAFSTRINQKDGFNVVSMLSDKATTTVGGVPVQVAYADTPGITSIAIEILEAGAVVAAPSALSPYLLNGLRPSIVPPRFR